MSGVLDSECRQGHGWRLSMADSMRLADYACLHCIDCHMLLQRWRRRSGLALPACVLDSI